MDKLTPITRRIIICLIGLIALISIGIFESEDAMVIVSMVVGGFLSLLKGIE